VTINPFDALVVVAGLAGVAAFVGTLVARSALPPDVGKPDEPEPDDPYDFSRGLRRAIKVRPPLRFKDPS